MLRTISGKYRELFESFFNISRHYNHSKDLLEVARLLEAPPTSLTSMGLYGGDQISINNNLEATQKRLLELKVHLLGAVTYLNESQGIDITELCVDCNKKLDEVIALLSNVISYSQKTPLSSAMMHSIQKQFKKLLISLASSLHILAKFLVADLKKQKPIRRLIDHFQGQFEFHTGSPYAAYDVLRSRRPSDRLTRVEVKKVGQLLDAYQHHVTDVVRISEGGNWIDLGKKKDPVRVLIDREHPKRVYFIIPISKHDLYENQLNKRPPAFHSANRN